MYLCMFNIVRSVVVVWVLVVLTALPLSYYFWLLFSSCFSFAVDVSSSHGWGVRLFFLFWVFIFVKTSNVFLYLRLVGLLRFCWSIYNYYEFCSVCVAVLHSLSFFFLLSAFFVLFFFLKILNGDSSRLFHTLRNFLKCFN